MSEPSELLLQHLPDIEQIIASICRRKGMDADATEEFSAEVKLRLIERDYAIVRAFKGRSPFPVYIAAVVRHLLMDRQNHEWGKWRPSAEAQRLGPLAVELERLVYRDGRSISDAYRVLSAKYAEATAAELERLAVRLPPRVRRRNVDIEEATAVPAPENRLDAIGRETATRLSDVVSSFIDTLPEEDQLIFRLRFDSCMTVAQIARALKLDQALLYRRFYRHCDELRVELERAGITAEDVEELIGTESFLDFNLKKRGGRPSNDQEESEVEARQEEISS